jgi:iron-sulfur cluster repair protein YtfE (RIC family)
MMNDNGPDILSSWSVNATIRQFPATIPVFNQFGVDSCCGGEATLDEAAADAGMEVAALITALREAAAGEGAVTR